MSANIASRRSKDVLALFGGDTLNAEDAISALNNGAISSPASNGRRARRRAKAAKLKNAGFLAPLLAAQGCLNLGKEELPLGAAGDPADGAGGSGTNSSSGGGEPIDAMTDEFRLDVDGTLNVSVEQLLQNDVADDPASLEVTRVFNAVNGEVSLDGDMVIFTPDDGYEGLATFQYEVRDANGNTSIASVEVEVGEGGDHAHGDGGHGDGGHGEGGHAHPDDPAKAGEHTALLNLVPEDDATHVAVNNGSWFDPSTWANGEVPGDGAKVLISEGVTVSYDGESNVSLFTVRVDGKLDFATDQNTFMEVDTFVVSPKGHLTIGTVDNPVAENFEAIIQIADNGPIDVAWDPMLLSRGLISHGKIEVHGAEKDTFLRLAEDPMAGDTSLVLEGAPEGWNVGDRLVITGTEMGTRTRGASGTQREITTQDEELTITRIEGNVIHFAEPLIYDHDTPRGDLKGYVANYSRNVDVVTENADDLPPSQRGHAMFMHSDDIDVRYAEFSDLGRTDKSQRAFDAADVDNIASDTNVKGRYSLHIHRAGVGDEDSPAMVVGNAVWGSPGWGYVHHDSNAILADNAAYDVFGAAFVAESGNEIGRWVHNISIKNHGVNGVDWNLSTPKAGSDVGAFDLGRNGTGFWFQGRQVDAVDNVAAGSPGGHGFTYFHRGSDGTNVEADSLRTPEIANYERDTILKDRAPISQFDDNEAIAVGTGLMVIKSNSEQRHDGRSLIEDFTAWNVRNGVHLEYTAHYTLLNLDVVAADAETKENFYGVNVGTEVFDFIVIGATIDGFHWGVRSNTDMDNGADSRHFYVDVDILNPRDDARGPGETYYNLDPDAQILTGAEAAVLPGVGELSFLSNFPEFGTLGTGTLGRQNLDGIKTDSLGEVAIGDIDRQLYAQQSPSRAAVEEGYWTLPDGRAVVGLERYFTDRATGEELKTVTFVELPGGVAEAQRVGAEYHGVLDQTGSGPNAVDDVVTVGAGERITVDVLANDSDPEGDAIAIDGVGEARHGSVWVNEDGTVTYQPDPNFTGEDEFFYWVEDDNGNFSRADVHVTVEV